MRARVWTVVAGWLLVGTGVVRAEEVKRPAELVPGSALAYAELRQPGAVAGEAAGLFEGSAVSRFPQQLARWREQSGRWRKAEEWGVISLLLSPEMVRELGRVRGVAGALLGFGPRGGPQFVVIVQPGESTVPAFAMRAYVTMERVRAVGEVEGVTLYRPVRAFGDGGRPEGSPHERGPTVAMTPDTLLIGSTEAVKDVLRRLHGHGDGPSLAEVEGYRQARAALGEGPGLFSFTNLPALLERVERVPMPNPEVFRAFKDVANPKVVRWLASALTLENGTLRYRLTVHLDPQEKSPLVEVLPSGPFDAGLLKAVPADALLAAGISNADGEKRWDRLLELADGIARALGKDEVMPSRHIAEVEGALGFRIGKDLLGRIRQAAFVLGDPLRAHEGRERGIPPMAFLVEANDEAAAKALTDEVLRRGYSLARRGNRSPAVAKEVGGEKVMAFDEGRRDAFYYARRGRVVVLGPEATFVAATAAGTHKGGAGESVWGRTAVVGQPIALLVSRPVPVLVATVAAASESSGDGEATVQEIRKLAREAEPFVLSITRSAQELRVEAQQGGLKPALGRMVDFFLERNLGGPMPSPARDRAANGDR